MRIYIYILIFFPLTLFAQKKEQEKVVEKIITLDEKNLVRDGNNLYKLKNICFQDISLESE